MSYVEIKGVNVAEAVATADTLKSRIDTEV